MTGMESRPMSVGELLDRTFSFYRHNFVVFFGIMILPSLLSSLGGLGMVLLQPRIDGGGSPDFGLAAALLFIAAMFLSTIVNLIVYSAAVAATTVAVSEVQMGRNATIMGSYRLTGHRFWGVLGLSFTFMLIMFLGIAISAAAGAIVALPLGMVHAALGGMAMVSIIFIGMMATAVWMVRYGVAVPALMLEQISVGRALRRSAMLTKGFRLRVVLMVFLMMIIGYVAAIIFQGPFFIMGFFAMEDGQFPVWIQIMQIISGSIGGALSGPLLLIGLALLYFDVRVRKEALDLEIIMAGWGPPGSPGRLA